MKHVLITGLLAIVATTATAQYTVTILNPVNLRQCELSGTSGGLQVGWTSQPDPPYRYSAMLWAGNASTPVDLNPPGYYESEAYGAFGNVQVGFGLASDLSNPRDPHALMWKGTASSFVDLNPPGFRSSRAFGASDGVQVGEGSPAFPPDLEYHSHALLWRGSPLNVEDLNPPGFSWSTAYGVSGGTQVGSGGGVGFFGPHTDAHALLWQGTASSFVDLHPAGFTNSYAVGIGDGQQVGYAIDRIGFYHAMLWRGTALSAVDLNPPGDYDCLATAVLGNTQVGVGLTGALLWRGSPSTAVNLHAFLINLTYAGQPIFLANSYATGISSDGSIVGHGYDGRGTTCALLWTPSKQQLVRPDSYSVQRGRVAGPSGTYLLDSGDGQSLQLYAGPSNYLAETRIQMVVDGTSSLSSVSDLKFDLVAVTDGSGVHQQIELYDWRAGGYIGLDDRRVYGDVNTIELTATDPNRFIQPGTGTLRARLSYQALGLPSWTPFNVFVDQTVWRVTP